MDSRVSGSASFAFGIGWRVLLAACLSVLFVYVVSNTQYYATALVLAAVTGLTLLDIVRMSRRPDVLVSTALRAQFHDQARQLDQMAALLDTVTVALIAVAPNGNITFANRAARVLAGEDVGRLADISALGPDVAGTLLGLPPGSRQIITVADGSSVLAWSGAFTVPGLAAQKLISLQTVVGELDAVQLRAWQTMIRVLSHEIMNSLTPISSLSESLPDLLSNHAEKEVADAVETIARRSQHLMNFVERYRQIASLPEPKPQEIKLAQFVADIDALMCPSFSARGIAYRSALIPRDLTVNADPELLSQAVINLLHNAADATAGATSPAIGLSVGRSGAEIGFNVSDNGAGVPADQLEEIFVPFFTTKSSGSGIGLTLVRQIAQAHGGKIEAIPQQIQGMTFRLVIPNGSKNEF
jgi:two-component system nitrogen regulation sensor histidine kinase NtrY